MTAGLLALAASAAVLPLQAGLHGTVRSSDSRPVEYARVDVVGHDLSDWTDHDGRYRVDGLSAGRWQLVVVHPNHDSLTLEVFVPGARGLALDLVLRSRPGPPVDALSDFQPFEMEYTLPTLLNTEEVRALIRGRYPQELAALGIGGESVLRLWLDERGQVVRTVIRRSSGHRALDSVAGEVAERMRFRPAKSGEFPVRVIVHIPVVFNPPPPPEGSAIGSRDPATGS